MENNELLRETCVQSLSLARCSFDINFSTLRTSYNRSIISYDNMRVRVQIILAGPGIRVRSFPSKVSTR